MDNFENKVSNKEMHIKSKSKNKDKSKNTNKKKIHISRDNRNSAFRNNYKHYQYDYEEDFYEPH